MNLTFVESRPFTVRWHNRLDDESLRSLQNLLLVHPSAGAPIPGCPMLRKLRFADESRAKGKRGGVRVIYLHTPEAGQIDLIAVYGKDEADDLTPVQLKQLCAYARQLRTESVRRVRARQAPRSKEA